MPKATYNVHQLTLAPKRSPQIRVLWGFYCGVTERLCDTVDALILFLVEQILKR